MPGEGSTTTWRRLNSRAPQRRVERERQVPLGSRVGVGRKPHVRAIEQVHVGQGPGVPAQPCPAGRAPARDRVVLAVGIGAVPPLGRWAVQLPRLGPILGPVGEQLRRGSVVASPAQPHDTPRSRYGPRTPTRRCGRRVPTLASPYSSSPAGHREHGRSVLGRVLHRVGGPPWHIVSLHRVVGTRQHPRAPYVTAQHDLW